MAQGAYGKIENKQTVRESSTNIVIIGNTAQTFAHIIDAWLLIRTGWKKWT